MSFIIAVYVHEGIVLASDSRTTYNITEKNGASTVVSNALHTTDSTDKTFLASSKIGISVCGEASINGIPITGYIEDFIRQEITEDTDIDCVPKLVIDYFNRFSPVPKTKFIIAGYRKTGEAMEQKVYKVTVQPQKIETIATQGQGASWDGEVSALTRLIQPAAVKDKDGKYIDLPNYPIPWGLFTLRDAIDFAKFAVDVTINTMRYQLVAETVGGPVDILVLKPGEAFWVQKKRLDAAGPVC